ncbi:MAG: hypothetical protein E5299_02437 [Burkholderia gladioli]|nr:MAG: hypothetical protein E5299_02437 [Burkholderia gladioli]
MHEILIRFRKASRMSAFIASSKTFQHTWPRFFTVDITERLSRRLATRRSGVLPICA